MRISYRTHPVLQDICEGRANPTYSKAFQGYEKNWLKSLPKLKPIYYLSKPFIEAVSSAQKHLLKIINCQGLICEGTFIVGNTVYCVDLVRVNNETAGNIFVFGTQSGLMLAQWEEGKGLFSWIHPQHPLASKQGAEDEFLANALLISTLIQYAKVETVVLSPNKKVRSNRLPEHKAMNDTKLPIVYLDSKWFTNIVRSEGFKVRGHFRLQSKKVSGEWTKELIWIEDFMKTGYTHNAKIITQNERDND